MALVLSSDNDTGDILSELPDQFRLNPDEIYYQGSYQGFLDHSLPQLINYFRCSTETPLQHPLALSLVSEVAHLDTMKELVTTHFPHGRFLSLISLFVICPVENEDFTLKTDAAWLFESFPELDVAAGVAPPLVWMDLIKPDKLGAVASQLIDLMPVLKRRHCCDGMSKFVEGAPKIYELMVAIYEFESSDGSCWRSIRDSLSILSVLAIRRRCPFLPISLRSDIPKTIDAYLKGYRMPHHVMLYISSPAKRNLTSNSTTLSTLTPDGSTGVHKDLLDIIDICIDRFKTAETLSSLLDLVYMQGTRTLSTDLAQNITKHPLRVKRAQIGGSTTAPTDARTMRVSRFLLDVVAKTWSTRSSLELNYLMKDVFDRCDTWSVHNRGSFHLLWDKNAVSPVSGQLNSMDGKLTPSFDPLLSDQLFITIAEWMEANQSNLMVVTGSSQLVRTSLVLDLFTRGLAEEHYSFARKLEVGMRSHKHAFVSSVLALVQRTIGGRTVRDGNEVIPGLAVDFQRAIKMESDEPQTTMEAYIRKISELTAQLPVRPTLFVIDGIEHALNKSYELQQEVLNCVTVLLDLAPSWLKIIVTASTKFVVTPLLLGRPHEELAIVHNTNHIRSYFLPGLISDYVAEMNWSCPDPKDPFRVPGEPHVEWERVDEFLQSIRDPEILHVKCGDDSDSSMTLMPSLAVVTTSPLQLVALVQMMEDPVRHPIQGHDKFIYFLGTLGGEPVVVTKADPGSEAQRGLKYTLAALRYDWPSLKAIVGAETKSVDSYKLPYIIVSKEIVESTFLDSPVPDNDDDDVWTIFVDEDAIPSSDDDGISVADSLRTAWLNVINGAESIVNDSTQSSDSAPSSHNSPQPPEHRPSEPQEPSVRNAASSSSASFESETSSHLNESHFSTPVVSTRHRSSSEPVASSPRPSTSVSSPTALPGLRTPSSKPSLTEVISETHNVLAVQGNILSALNKRVIGVPVVTGTLAPSRSPSVKSAPRSTRSDHNTQAHAGFIPAAAVHTTIGIAGLKDHKIWPKVLDGAVHTALHLSLCIGASDWVKQLPKPAGAGFKILAFNRFITEKTKDFVGRVRLSQFVDDWRTRPKGQFLLIQGDPGVGKSALAAQLAKGGPAHHIAALHFCRYDDIKTLEAGFWLCSIAGQLVDWARLQGFNPSDDCLGAVLDRQDTASVIEAWVTFLEALKTSVHYKGTPVLIVMDSLDEAVDAGGVEGTKIVEALAHGLTTMPWWLKIVATSRNEPLVVDLLPTENIKVVLMEKSNRENVQDLRQFVRNRMGPDALDENVDAVADQADGNFMAAVQLLSNWIPGESDRLSPTGPALGGTLNEMYTALARRLFPTEVEFNDVLPVLDVLAAAKAPLPRPMFDEALKIARVHPRALGGYLDGLRSVLDSSDNTVRFYHKAFADWLLYVGYKPENADKVLKGNRIRGHDYLTKACAAFWPSRIKGDYADKYLCAHAVEGSVVGLDEAIAAIGGVDVEAGDYYAYYTGDPEKPWGTARLNMFWMACRAGNVEIIRVLVKKSGSDVIDSQDRDGWTPLYVACRSGRLEVVRALVEEFESQAGEIPNKYGKTPLLIACSYGSLDVVKYLIDEAGLSCCLSKLDAHKRTPLFAAASRGRTEVVGYLLSKRAPGVDMLDKSGRNPLWIACSRGYWQIAKILLEEDVTQLDCVDGHGESPFWTACHGGYAKIVEMLLRDHGRRVDINAANADGETPLYAACRRGHFEVVRLLLKRRPGGLPVVATDTATEHGRTALWTACANGYVKIVALLLNRVGSQELRRKPNDGRTPLFVAAQHGHFGVVRFLSQHSKWSDQLPLILDQDGETPLMIASKFGRIEVVKLLLKLAPKAATLADSRGVFPIQVALQKGHKDIVELLRDSEHHPQQRPVESSSPRTFEAMHWSPRRSRLFQACADGDLPALKRLLYSYSFRQRMRVVDEVDVNGYTLLWTATCNGHAAIVSYLLVAMKSKAVDTMCGQFPKTPLMVAIEAGRNDMVLTLLRFGNPGLVDERGRNGDPHVFVAAERGFTDVLRSLLIVGDPAAVDVPNHRGVTPLHIAAKNGHVEVVRALLTEFGSKAVDLRDSKDQTPLFSACERGYVEIAGLLLCEGNAQSLETKDEAGMTPRAIAEKHGRDEIARLLGYARLSHHGPWKTPKSRNVKRAHAQLKAFRK